MHFLLKCVNEMKMQVLSKYFCPRLYYVSFVKILMFTIVWKNCIKMKQIELMHFNFKIAISLTGTYKYVLMKMFC